MKNRPRIIASALVTALILMVPATRSLAGDPDVYLNASPPAAPQSSPHDGWGEHPRLDGGSRREVSQADADVYLRSVPSTGASDADVDDSAEGLSRFLEVAGDLLAGLLH